MLCMTAARVPCGSCARRPGINSEVKMVFILAEQDSLKACTLAVVSESVAGRLMSYYRAVTQEKTHYSLEQLARKNSSGPFSSPE